GRRWACGARHRRGWALPFGVCIASRCRGHRGTRPSARALRPRRPTPRTAAIGHAACCPPCPSCLGQAISSCGGGGLAQEDAAGGGLGEDGGVLLVLEDVEGLAPLVGLHEGEAVLVLDGVVGV